MVKYKYHKLQEYNMKNITWLFDTFSIIVVINAISSILWYWPKTKKALVTVDNVEDSTNKWTWKDTIALVLKICALALLIGAAIFLNMKYVRHALWILVLLSYYLDAGEKLFPSMEIIGNIVRGNGTGELNRHDGVAILTIAMVWFYLNMLEIPSKVEHFANSLTSSVLADWVLILLYVLSIFLCVFFCCSLSIIPLKLIVTIFRRAWGWIPKQKVDKAFRRIGTFANSNFSEKTVTIYLLEYSFSKKYIVRLLLWFLLIPAITLDIVRTFTLFLLAMLASIIWSLYLILVHLAGVIAKMIAWLACLEGRSVVAISFRIAIILGFGFTVIMNRYEPFLHNHEESTAILEFISSSIIIPVIFEWIISYKRKKKKKEFPNEAE